MASGDQSDFDYDLFVIGGGSGGVRAARIAAGYGARVGIAEESRYGGTCVIRGCVPKKLMVYASQFSEAFEDAAGFGWTVPEAAFDWVRFMTAKDAEIARLEGVYRRNLESAGVETHSCRATIAGPHEVLLSDHGRAVSAKHILVAVGGRPFVPDFPGSQHAVTSDDMFLMTRLPKRILVAGGGFIACEFASIMNGLGVETTLIYRGDEVLRGFDADVRRAVREGMAAKGVRFIFGEVLRNLEKTPDGLVAEVTNGDRLEIDVALFATGRRPNTDGLGLEAAGVELLENGAVPVDVYSRTSTPSVYAVGDVTDRINLTPVAIREGHAFADTVFGGQPTPMDHSLVASAVFAQPEAGVVGLTEQQARQEGEVEIYQQNFRPMQHTLSGREERMMMKLVVGKENRKVLGVHIVGRGAGEMIQCLGIAVRMGATKEDFDRTVAVHPTSAEELVTMRTPVAE